MSIVNDSVLERTTSSGVGDLTLGAGVVAGYVAVAERLSDQENATFLIESVDSNNNPTGAFEICKGVYWNGGAGHNANSVQRLTVLRSKGDGQNPLSGGADSKVNWGSSVKTVSVIPDPRVTPAPSYPKANLPTLGLYDTAIVIAQDWLAEDGGTAPRPVYWNGNTWKPVSPVRIRQTFVDAGSSFTLDHNPKGGMIIGYFNGSITGFSPSPSAYEYNLVGKVLTLGTALDGTGDFFVAVYDTDDSA